MSNGGPASVVRSYTGATPDRASRYPRKARAIARKVVYVMLISGNGCSMTWIVANASATADICQLNCQKRRSNIGHIRDIIIPFKSERCVAYQRYRNSSCRLPTSAKENRVCRRPTRFHGISSAFQLDNIR